MSLDPKYADLPWIAHGQPDVYEAGELPEADQRPFGDEIGDSMLPKEIETMKLSVTEAQKSFASSRVDATGVDFSDSISGSRKIGYTIDTDVYEILPPNAREQESLQSRFQRLQTEVAELLNDLASSHDESDVAKDKSITPATLFKLTQNLRSQLGEAEVREISDASTEDRDTGLLSNVLDLLDNFKFEKSEDKKPSSADHLVYEIYDRHASSSLLNMEKISDIDRRIQRLEALIGQPDPSKLSALTADTAQHSLLEAAARLSARSALLNPGHLDMIEARLTALQNKLQAITEKPEPLADADTQNKVAELFELVKKWNDVAESLPMVVERLTELNELHKEAAEFSSVLSEVESSQRNVEQQLSTYSRLLEEVRNNWNENVQLIKKNMTNLESRIPK